jgi:hypothetical protein
MEEVSRSIGRLEAKWDGIVGEGKTGESRVKYDKPAIPTPESDLRMMLRSLKPAQSFIVTAFNSV